jgi:hypothetical protein
MSRFLVLLAVATLAAGPTLATEQTKREKTVKPAVSSAKSLEARHNECLAFMQRHGLSCDPWQQPTCGYDLGMFRPLSCVAP